MMVTRLRRYFAVGAVTFVMAGAVPLASRAAGDTADTVPASFRASASSDAFRLQYDIPKFDAVERIIDGVGPRAHVELDSVGSSQAFASFPYPGDLAVNGPGLIAIFTGFPFPVTYPLYIEANASKPSDRIDQPGLHLAVDAAAERVAAISQVGEITTTGSVGSRSVATSDILRADDGSVIAAAETMLGEFRLGPFELRGFRTAVKAARDASGKVSRTASMDLGAMTIAGVPIGVTGDGLVIGSSKTPIADFPPVAEALKGAGIRVSLLAPVEVPDGVAAGGLQIEQATPLPNLGTAATVRIQFGRATASVSASSPGFGDGSALPSIGGPLPPLSDSPVASAPAEPPATGSPFDVSVGQIGIADAAGAPVDTNADPRYPGAPAPETMVRTPGKDSVQQAMPPGTPVAFEPDPLDGGTYLLLVLAVALGMVSAVSFRSGRARSTWNF